MGKAEEYLEFVAPDEISVKGSRIGIESVPFAHLDQGVPPDELRSWFPALSAAEIEAVLGYARLHGAGVEKYLQAVRGREERVFRRAELNPSPAMRLIRELRAKLAAEGKLPGQALRRG
jgi:hypothetical protein